MSRYAPLLLLVVCAAACRTGNSALIARIRSVTEQPSSPARAEAAPPPGAPVPVPWNKGQFAVWSVKDGEQTSLVGAAVEDAGGEGAVVTITTVSPTLRTTAKLTFVRQPYTREEARQLLTQVVRQRGDERPFTYRFRKQMPVDLREALEPLWATLVPERLDASPEPADAPAAKAQGCLPAQGFFVYPPLGLEVRALLHPAVPINGVVTARAKGGQTVQLVDMGWSGGGPKL